MKETNRSEHDGKRCHPRSRCVKYTVIDLSKSILGTTRRFIISIVPLREDETPRSLPWGAQNFILAQGFTTANVLLETDNRTSAL